MKFNHFQQLVFMSSDAGFGGGGGSAPNHQSSTAKFVCCSPSCVMPDEPVELNPHDPTKPRFSCAMSSCNGPLHGGACATEVGDGVFVCHRCINKMIATNNNKESSGGVTEEEESDDENKKDENKKQAAGPTNVDKDSLPTIFFHKGMRVDGRPSDTYTSIVTLNPDTDSNDNDLIDGSNVSNTEHTPISEVDKAELVAVVNFCFGGKKSEVVEQLMEKRMCINLQEIIKVRRESADYFRNKGKYSYSYPLDTITVRGKWLPSKNTMNDSNISGTTDRYTVADIKQYVWFEAIFTELEKMLMGSYCRFQRGFWYFLSSKLPKDNQITKEQFDEIITEVCNIIGTSRIKLNIIVVSEGSLVAPMIFYRGEEELTITIDGQPRNVVRFAEEYDLTTPSPIPLTLLTDFEKVDSMDVHFEIKAERKYEPKYCMAIEAAEVANNMFDQYGMWKAKNKSGMVLYYKGVPKSYHRFLLWMCQKYLQMKILVSFDVNPWGIRGGNALSKPGTHHGHINVPESKYLLDDVTWIGPFPSDVLALKEKDSSLTLTNKQWTQQEQTYLGNQLSNEDGHSFIHRGPYKKERKEQAKLMKKNLIKFEAEGVEGLTSLLFRRAWAVSLNLPGWKKKMGM